MCDWAEQPFYDGREWITVFSVPGLWWRWKEEPPGEWRHEYMVTELHDKGTLNEHYAHPEGLDKHCAKCVDPRSPEVNTDRAQLQALGNTPPTENEGAQERRALMKRFEEMLWLVTGDGGRKRAAGAKPPWWRDPSHEAAIFSHLNKWKHGETHDHDSGAHPLVHLAWRALAIAYQETYGQVPIQEVA